MNLAYFSPLAPQRSGIADYSEELLPYLAERASLDLFADDYLPSNRRLVDRFAVFPGHAFDRVAAGRRYDATIYQLGNHPYHAYVWRALTRSPGIVVLHDYVLHHLVVQMTVARGNPAGYAREMAYCDGSAGLEEALDVLLEARPFPYERYPLNQRVLDASLGVIVHSEYVRRLLLARSPDAKVAVVRSHASPSADRPSRQEAREALKLDDETLVIGSFGLASPAKRLDVALRAYANVRSQLPASRLAIVGEVPPEASLADLIYSLGLEDSVDVTGYVPRDVFLRYVAASDVALNLRWPTMGETSASFIRLLAAGVPTVVSDVGSFREFPDDCCCKVPVGDGEVERVAFWLTELGRDRPRRADVGARAQEYVRAYHSIERSADGYILAIRQFLR